LRKPSKYKSDLQILRSINRKFSQFTYTIKKIPHVLFVNFRMVAAGTIVNSMRLADSVGCGGGVNLSKIPSPETPR
jgi:hypothetical protein